MLDSKICTNHAWHPPEVLATPLVAMQRINARQTRNWSIVSQIRHRFDARPEFCLRRLRDEP